VNSGAEIRTFAGHTDPVWSVAFSPDGRYALSGSLDKTLKLWEVNTGAKIRTFVGHTDYVYSVAFSPDGRYAFSGSLDRTLKMWETGIHTSSSSTKNISARMNQSAYQIGEHFSFKLDLNEEPTQPSPYDIYAVLLFPQGSFITIAYPLTISLPGTILPYRKNVTVSGSQTFPILDLDLPQGLALGTYSGCGIVAPVDSDPWQMENWIAWHCQAFDLY